MATITTEVYTLDELNENAKNKARDWFRQCNDCDTFWSENVIEDATQIGALMGIDISNVYFSGFSCQGDGACFTGRYSYAKGSVSAVKAHAPQDTELHRIAAELFSLQRRHFYRLYSQVSHNGRYSHEWSMEFCTEESAETEDALAELLRDFARWIYRQLESEYDYQNSDEQIDDAITANEYTFTANGRRF